MRSAYCALRATGYGLLKATLRRYGTDGRLPTNSLVCGSVSKRRNKAIAPYGSLTGGRRRRRHGFRTGAAQCAPLIAPYDLPLAVEEGSGTRIGRSVGVVWSVVVGSVMVRAARRRRVIVPALPTLSHLLSLLVLLGCIHRWRGRLG